LRKCPNKVATELRMAKAITFFTILLITITCKAQKVDTIFVSTNDTLINNNGQFIQLIKADKLPDFPGGQKAYSRFLENAIYLYAASHTQTAILSYVVEPDGKLTEIKLLNEVELETAVAKNALQIFKQSPNWIPAAYKGRKVRFFATQQIEYNRDN
jgi:Gram-negative bacterial TonB protein C-terminal